MTSLILRGARPARRARHVLLFTLMLVAPAACSDSPVSPGASPRTHLPPLDAASQVGTSASLASLIDALDQEDRRLGGEASNLRGTTVVDGKTVTLVGPAAMRAALTSPTVGGRPAGRDGAAGDPSSFGIPYDDSNDMQIVNFASVALVNVNAFTFAAATTINKSGSAQYTHRSTRSVTQFSSTTSTPIWTETASHTLLTANGAGVTSWPDFVMTGGCSLRAQMVTQHTVTWPVGGYLPTVLRKTLQSTSVGQNQVARPCANVPPAPPAPPPAHPYCDDANGSGCIDAGPPGGGTRYSGGTVQREIGRTGGFKTVCYVTDWYENGGYVETTIDRCWTEPYY